MQFTFPELDRNTSLRCRKELILKGYTVLRNVVSMKFIRQIERESTSLSWGNIGVAEINTITTSNMCTLSSSHNLVELSDTYKSLYLNKQISDFYFDVIGENASFATMINSSYFFKAKESKDIRIHQDNAYFNLNCGINCLTFYIPIHHHSKSRGTIFYYRGSHLLGSLKHVPEGNIGASMCLDMNKDPWKSSKKKVDYPELFPGDLVVHNALVVHGTLPNPKNKQCEAFNFTLFGETNEIDKNKYDMYRHLLKKFLVQKKRHSI